MARLGSAGSAAAGITSNTVPWELLRAAGYAPVLLEWEAGPAPYADRFMEDVFDPRMRVIFDRIVAGAWRHLALVVVSRASEQEHKLYLYLREAERMGAAKSVPPLRLYNLLHTRSPEAYQYGLERTRQMAAEIGAGESELRDAIEESNRARAAIRRVLSLRERRLLPGSAAVDLIRGFYHRDRGEFASDIEKQLTRLEENAVATGPRILIKGVSLDRPDLHSAIERQGGYVFAEDDWRGSRAAGERDVAIDGDPVRAVFEKYFSDTVSPRVFPSAVADQWFRNQIESGQADAVVFYLPPSDDCIGWDYPRLRSFTEERGIPSLLVRESIFGDSAPQIEAEISIFLRELPHCGS